MATKRTYRRRYRRRGKKKESLITHKSWKTLGSGFPEKVCVTLKYNDLINFSPAAGAYATYQFRANSIYDPNYTGVGRQPRFRDQLMDLYNHYVVIGSKIRVTWSPRWDDDTTGNTNVLAGVYLNDDTTITPTTAIEFSEISGGLHGRNVKFMAPGSSTPYVITKTFSGRKVFGKYDLNNSNFRGTATTNPTEESIYTLWIYNNDGGAVAAYWSCFVEIEYIVVFSELKDIAGS